MSFNETSVLVCNPQELGGTISAIVFPVLQIIINVVVIAAVLQSRRRLRHNFVYVYVINSLVVNVIFGLFSGYHMLTYVLNIEKVNGTLPNEDKIYNTHQSIKTWWTFRSGFVLNLFLTMSGSVSALIYGIRESSYFVSRTAVHFARAGASKPASSQTNSTRVIFYRTLVIIALVWTIPFILTIASAAGWSCVQHCYCTFGFYGSDVYFCHTDILRECSRFYQPHRNDFLLLSVCIWMLESLGIIYMNVTTVIKYVSVLHEINRPANMKSVDVPSDNDLSKRKLSETKIATLSSNTSGEKMTSSGRHHCNGKTKSPGKRFCSLLPLNSNIKLLFLTSLFFIILTMPIMAMIVVDVASSEYVLPFWVVVASFMSTLLYCCISPILLVCFMPGLQAAMQRGLFKLSCCCTTTVSTRPTSISTDQSSDY